MALFCYWMLAAKSLKDESMKVYRELKKRRFKGKARRAVSMIVGRDTDQLTAEGVTKAAVETVAENASDGVMAPLLYLAVGDMYSELFIRQSTRWILWSDIRMRNICISVVLRQRWTMYSITFRQDCLLFLWWRRQDLPACRQKNAWKIFKRDRYNHASPNSAQTEAPWQGHSACACRRCLVFWSFI